MCEGHYAACTRSLSAKLAEIGSSSNSFKSNYLTRILNREKLIGSHAESDSRYNRLFFQRPPDIFISFTNSSLNHETFDEDENFPTTVISKPSYAHFGNITDSSGETTKLTRVSHTEIIFKTDICRLKFISNLRINHFPQQIKYRNHGKRRLQRKLLITLTFRNIFDI